MSPRFQTKPPRTLDCPDLRDAYLEFILSRQAKHLTSNTLDFYKQTCLPFLLWTESQGIQSPKQITSRHVRQYISDLIDRGKKDTTCHDHARAIRTIMRFFHAEGLIHKPVIFDMPKLQKKRLPVLDEEQLRTVLRACNTRDKAIVMFMADCGIRREEIIRLNWGDVNFDNGLVNVIQGKGQKDRAVVVGARTRRALLQYRRKIKWNDKTPLFLSRTGGRFTGDGFEIIFRRLKRRTGVPITPHALRRTYVILSLRKGTDPGHVQAMLGHESLDMLYYYAQLENIDLLRAQLTNSPVDGLY